ncbi:MAG: hypothetical protein JXO72_16025 [Vicinamibacteria bacterium]|nr:hypothetical protein [Vicinamibacteria bacterium]
MNLKEWLYRSHTPAEQLKALEGVCNALHQAHSQGELRNGVGPENVQIVSDTEFTIDRPGVIPASHRAPEERPTPTTGIFSAGVILYEILTGKNPFGGSPPGSAQPTPLKSVRRDISGDLSDAIMACLESDPDWRPKDLSYVLQVVQRLRSAGDAPKPSPVGGTRGSRPPSRPISRPSSRTSARAPRFDHMQRQRRVGAPVLLIVLGALTVLGAGVWYWQKNAQGLFRPSPTTVPPSAVPAGDARSPAAITTAPAVSTPFAVPGVISSPTPPTVIATPWMQPTPLTMTVVTPAPTMPTPFIAVIPTPFVPAVPTPRPYSTPPRAVIEPITPPPLTPAPTVAPTPPPPAEPATLNALAPRTMTRGQRSLFDLHGAGIRADHRPMVLKGGAAVAGVAIVQKKLVSPKLLRILVNVEGSVVPGGYSIVLVDEAGKSSNAVAFEIKN